MIDALNQMLARYLELVLKPPKRWRPVIRSIDFCDELAKWTAIEMIKGIGQCIETVSGNDDLRSRLVFNECCNSSASLREPRLTP
jgi:hypothetical protein